MGLRMLANTVRGLSQDHMRRLYISCILPILTYASAVWWMQQQWQVQQLQRVQNLCLCMSCAVFRTSPIYALQVEAGIPLIQYTLDKCDDLAAARLHKLGPHSPVLQRVSKAWHGRVRFEKPLVQHRKRRTYSTLQYLSKLTSPHNERINPFQIAPWALALQERFPGRVHLRPAPKGAKKPDAAEAHTREVQMLGWDPKQLIVYTDGSLLQTPRGRSTGAAFVVYQEEEEIAHGCIPMGARAEVYDAEMCALASAMDHVAHYMDFDLGSISHLHFYADNTSSVSTILDSRPRPSQRFSISFCEHAAEWLAADGSHQLSVSWVPSHVDVLCYGSFGHTLFRRRTSSLAPHSLRARTPSLRHSATPVHHSDRSPPPRMRPHVRRVIAPSYEHDSLFPGVYKAVPAPSMYLRFELVYQPFDTSRPLLLL